jgi:surface carbohydrate biosynthesis protein
LKVVLVVDNPKRDLSGLTLLSYELSKYNIEVYLVPMYDQMLHILDLNPDFILLNYCRPINANKIKRYKFLGYKVGVLDTEGGILRDIYKELLVSVEKSNVESLLDVYFLWGNKQLEVFEKYFTGKELYTKLFSCGSPRYDFLNNDFRNFLSFDKNLKEYILIIASFPICNPKFVTLEEEAKNMTEALGYSLEQVRKIQENYLKRLNEYIYLIKKLLKEYPNEQFVLRAHPFEDHGLYQNEFKNYSNIVLNSEGEIFSVLHNAKLMIQINSSTGVEAAMIDIPVIQPEYMNVKEDNVEQITNSSYLAYSEEEFINLFNSFVLNKSNNYIDNRKKQIEEYIKQLTNDYFYKIDGKSSQRVAKEIFNFLNENSINKKETVLLFFKEYVISLLKISIKSLFNKRYIKNRQQKNFNVNVVKSISHFKNKDENNIHVIEQSYYYGMMKSNRIKIFLKKN